MALLFPQAFAATTTTGANYVEETTLNYTNIPGTRNQGGDDAAVGGQQQGADYATSTIAFTPPPGGSLVMRTDDWNAAGTMGTSTAGIELLFMDGNASPMDDVGNPTPARIESDPVLVLQNDGLIVGPITNFVTTAAVDTGGTPIGGTIATNFPGVTDPALVDVTYTSPSVDPNFSGFAFFDYTATDTCGNQISATVSIEVTNAIPMANDDDAAVDAGGSTNIVVLGNDFEGDSPPTSLTPVGGTFGTPVVQPDFTVTYTDDAPPNPGQTDTFTYTFIDANGDTSNQATVSVQICAAGAICAANDPVATDAQTQVVIGPLDNDAGLATPDFDISVVMGTGPQFGNIDATATPCTAPADCTISYTPNAGFPNPTDGNIDSFDYLVEDNDPGAPVSMDMATVFVTVNDTPVPVNDPNETALPGVATNLPIVAQNDTGLFDAPIKAVIETQPANGTVVPDLATPIEGVIYTSDVGYNGPDQFTYSLVDRDGDVSTGPDGVVDIDVNDIPVGVNDGDAMNPFALLDQNAGSTSLMMALNDMGLTDVPVTFAIDMSMGAPQAQLGTVSVINAPFPVDSLILYDPTANSGGGIDVFRYTITDDSGDMSTADVTVQILSAPTTRDFSTSTGQNRKIDINLLTEPPSPPIVDLGMDPITAFTFGIFLPPTNGTATVVKDDMAGTATTTYTPNTDFIGDDFYDISITDTGGNSVITRIFVNVVAAQNYLPGTTTALGPFGLGLLSMLAWFRRRLKR